MTRMHLTRASQQLFQRSPGPGPLGKVGALTILGAAALPSRVMKTRRFSK